MKSAQTSSSSEVQYDDSVAVCQLPRPPHQSLPTVPGSSRQSSTQALDDSHEQLEDSERRDSHIATFSWHRGSTVLFVARASLDAREGPRRSASVSVPAAVTEQSVAARHGQQRRRRGYSASRERPSAIPRICQASETKCHLQSESRLQNDRARSCLPACSSITPTPSSRLAFEPVCYQHRRARRRSTHAVRP